MVILLGMVMWFIINIWLTIFVICATVSTFSEGLFAGNLGKKILGIIMWIGILFCWYWMSRNIRITTG